MEYFSNYKKHILTVTSALLATPVVFQALVDFVSGDAVITKPFMLLFTTLSLMTAVGFFSKIPVLFRNFKISVEAVVAISAIAAWVACLFDWLGKDGAAGASYALYTVVPIFMAHLGRFLETNTLSDAPLGLEEERYALPETYLPLPASDEPALVRDIPVGAHVKVLKGNIIPVDGNVIEGMADVVGSIAIARAMARVCGPGDIVFAGEQILHGEMTIVANKNGAESLLAKAMSIDHLSTRDKITQTYIQPRARAYILLCLVFALTGLMYQSIMGGIIVGLQTFFLCIALAVPVTAVISYALPLEWLGRHLKDIGADLHSLDALVWGRKIKSLAVPVMDGLVRTTPSIDRIVSAKASEDEVLSVASGLCHQPNNPLSKALSNRVDQKNLTPTAFNSVEYEPGRGVVGDQNHGSYLIGNPTLMSRYRVPYRSLDDELTAYEATSDQLIWVAQAKPIRSFMGVIVCSTVLRHGVKRAVSDLEASPYHLMGFAHTETPKILNRAKATHIKDVKVYFDIKTSRRDYVSDDAPMAAIANNILHVGAFEAADIKIVGRNAPSSMTNRAHLSIRAMRPNNFLPILDALHYASLKTQQNILISLMASLGAVIYAVSGNMTPIVANAIAVSVMTSVVINALLSRRQHN